jgi:hypothetical protein
MNWLQKLSNNVKNNKITPNLESVIDGQIGKPNITTHDIALQTL